MPDDQVTKTRLPSGQACASCRRKKHRCDGKRPKCSGCLIRQIACEYPMSNPTEMSLDELKALIGAKQRESGLTEDATTFSFAKSDGRHQLGSQVEPTAGSNRPQEVSMTPFLTSVPDAQPPIDVAAQEPGEPHEGQDTPSTRASTPVEAHEPEGYFGESSTFSFVSKVRSESLQDEQSPRRKRRRLSIPARASLRNERDLAGVTLEKSQAHFELPGHELADSLVDAYFSHVHPLYPFIHEPKFRADYERLWEDESLLRNEKQASWFAVLNLIFAHGREFCDFTPQEDVMMSTSHFISQARSVILSCIFQGGSLEMVQAQLLLCHYLQGTLELNECWSLVGLMIRDAVGMGLHLDRVEDGFTSQAREMRRRVWWGCVIIDRTLSMKFGRPTSIRNLEESQVGLPSNVDDQYIMTGLQIPRQPAGRPSLTGFFIQTIKLTNVMEKVLQDLYQPRISNRIKLSFEVQPSDISHVLGSTVHLDGLLQAWWAQIPKYLKEADDATSGMEFQRQRNVIRLRFLSLRLLLTRQAFLVFSCHDIEDTFHRAVAVASAQTCIAAARETIRLIHIQYRERLLNSLWYNLFYVFTSMGVLLTQHTMNSAKARMIGKPSDEETLGLGMEFLEAASSTSKLASRYAKLLQRLRRKGERQGPTSERNRSDVQFDATHSTVVGQEVSFHGTSQDEVSYEFGDVQFSPFDGTILDPDDLLFGTGLPKDFLSKDWLNDDSRS